MSYIAAHAIVIIFSAAAAIAAFIYILHIFSRKTQSKKRILKKIQPTWKYFLWQLHWKSYTQFFRYAYPYIRFFLFCKTSKVTSKNETAATSNEKNTKKKIMRSVVVGWVFRTQTSAQMYHHFFFVVVVVIVADFVFSHWSFSLKVHCMIGWICVWMRGALFDLVM